MHRAARPAVFFANGIGDHLLNLPALRALSAIFRGRLTLVCRPGPRDILFADLPLARVCEAQTVDTERGRQFDAEQVSRALQGCDLLLSLNPWHSESVDQMLRQIAPRQSIGFFPAFGVHIPLDYEKHSADLAFDAAQHLEPSLRIERYARPPKIDRDAKRIAQRIRNSLPPGWRLMVVHADTSHDKMWPREKFVRVLDEFLTIHTNVVAVVVGHQPIDLASGRMGDRVVPCHGLRLAVSIALVAAADLFLGVDSCMLHAADLFRVPGVGLFGPTAPHEFGFRFGPHRHVSGRGSMDAIHVDDVLDQLMALAEA